MPFMNRTPPTSGSSNGVEAVSPISRSGTVVPSVTSLVCTASNICTNSAAAIPLRIESSVRTVVPLLNSTSAPRSRSGVTRLGASCSDMICVSLDAGLHEQAEPTLCLAIADEVEHGRVDERPHHEQHNLQKEGRHVAS